MNEFLTQSDVAVMLGCHSVTVARYAEEGTLPYYAFGKRKRFLKEDVENYIKGARREPNSTERNDTSISL